MDKQFNLVLDTKRTGFNVIRGLKQGDNNSVLNITLVQNSIPLDLNGLTVRINYKRPDSQLFLQMVDIVDAIEGKVKVNVLTQVLENVGEIQADLSIFNSNNRKITSITFSIFVDASIYRNDYIAPEDLDLIQSIWVEEDKRIKQENTRQSAETTRATDETVRQSNEDTRIANEIERVKSENIRVTNEDIRKLNEITRKNDEVIRQSAETARENNETVRQSNETQRVESEKIRVAQETARQTGYTNIQNTVNNFTVCEAYISTKDYKKFNRVTFGGSSYEAVKDVPKGIDPSNALYWICIAEKGKDGLGSGDMHTSVYDKNNNGIVDKAESITDGTTTYTTQDIKTELNKIGILSGQGEAKEKLNKETFDSFKTSTELHLMETATETKKGHIQLATQEEITAGIEDSKSVTAKKLKVELDKKMDKSGGNFTGIIQAQSNTSYTVKQVRNIILSPNDADVNLMADGDIWIKYK